MKKNSSGFVQIILLVLIVVAIGGAYYFGKMSNKQNVVETPTTIPVSSETSVKEETVIWKTYTNMALGFEIRYPSTVKIDKEMNDQYNRLVTFKNDNLNFQVSLHEVGNIDFNKYYYMDNPEYTKSTLGGMTANRYVYDAGKNSCVSDGNGPPCPVSYVVYVVQKGNDLYHLGFFGENVLSEVESQILSTFKFTNSKNDSSSELTKY